jgi:hypothetical protein
MAAMLFTLAPQIVLVIDAQDSLPEVVVTAAPISTPESARQTPRRNQPVQTLSARLLRSLSAVQQLFSWLHRAEAGFRPARAELRSSCLLRC